MNKTEKLTNLFNILLDEPPEKWPKELIQECTMLPISEDLTEFYNNLQRDLVAFYENEAD